MSRGLLQASASGILAAKMPKILAGEYSPQASIRNVLDSAEVAIKSAQGSRMTPAVLSASRDQLKRAMVDGYSEADVLALEKTIRANKS